MFEPAIRLILDTAFGLLTYAFLLRFAMQWLRTPFRNPLGQAVMALTDWAVKPARKVIPGYRASTARRSCWPGSASSHGFARSRCWWGVAASTARRGRRFALLACVELVKALIWLLIIVVIAQAVLSWVAPDGPFAGTLNAMTFRFLAPIRRVVPPVGGTLDLSPLILIVVLQLILILPIRWLESAVLSVFR
jgi:YggT family protein